MSTKLEQLKQDLHNFEIDSKYYEARVYRDLLHNLDPQNSGHLRLYKNLRYRFIRDGEAKVLYAYDDAATIDKSNRPKPIGEDTIINGNITIGIGFNMSNDSVARDAWKSAFGDSLDFDEVKKGKRKLTEEQVDILFNVSLDIRERELRRFYDVDFDKLRLNERLVIEDAYFNRADLVNKKSKFFKNICNYYNTGDNKELKKAIIQILYYSNKKKIKGLKHRRNKAAVLLNSFKAPFYSPPNSPLLPKEIRAHLGKTRIPYGLEDLPAHEDGKYYIWRTECDDKVRPDHFALEGKIFSDDHPPAAGWEPGNSKIHCRCHKQPLPANVVVIEDEIQNHKNDFLLPPTTNFNFNLRSDYMKTTTPVTPNSEHLVYRNQAWEQLKGVSDERRKQLEQSGYVDVLTEQKWQRINSEVDEQKARINSLEALVNRPTFAMSGESADNQDAEYKAAFIEYLRKGDAGQMQILEKKFLSVGSETEGGHFVGKEVSKQIIKKIEANSIMRKLASIEEVSTHVLEVLEDDGALESGWVSEIEQRDDTEAPTINKRRIEVHEVYAQPKATQKLIDDSQIDIANWLMEKIADKFADVESHAFISGDGVGKPKGILALPHGKDRDSIEQISISGNEISADDIMNLYYSLPSKYAARASFLMHRNMLQKIRTLKCPNTGHYIWAPGLAVGQPDTLLGAPVYESPHMPIPASGALSIAFADFKQAYKIVDRTNINIMRDPFTEKPFVKFYATKRVGGSVINTSAMKLLKAA